MKLVKQGSHVIREDRPHEQTVWSPYTDVEVAPCSCLALLPHKEKGLKVWIVPPHSTGTVYGLVLIATLHPPAVGEGSDLPGPYVLEGIGPFEFSHLFVHLLRRGGPLS